ncbi:MAG TPA: nucleoside triphosphate pyrophosphohydrolase [Rhizobiales bacterium]|jgi:MazG family protein|nr:nucleoside triphosphate pyrophosphohydrolase [Hyphomicrobiales bacterium]HCL61133.1 nucleoside triphosphate pyrophosphohydrolase [Hyphomicrobiales bacterium]
MPEQTSKPPGAERYTLEDLLAVMARLRDPVSGCPWDVKQSFATIAPYTIEEAYEVADAIAREDLVGLKDELGDLLLQVVYHAEMASELERFAFADVADAITRKMIRRHPHVFADPSLRQAFVANDLWRRIKAEEKAGRGEASASSTLGDVPLALPALTRAVKLQTRAAEVGFDWPSLAPVIAKAEEEIAELKIALDEARQVMDDRPAKRVVEEFGDLLFVMANLARHLGVDPEAALRDANAKFVRRFESIEAALAKDGRKPEDATLEEMDHLWDEAKAVETKS